MTTSISGHFAATNLLCMALLTVSVPVMAIDDRPAPGKPETMLGGVRIEQTRLRDIIRMYGPPIQEPGRYGEARISIHSAGEKDTYVWIKSCVVLYVSGPINGDGTVWSMNLSTSDSSCTAEDIAKEPIAQTGLGLRLRDDKTAWNRIYGNQLGFATESPDCCGGFWRERDESCDMITSKGERLLCYRRTKFGAAFNTAGKVVFFILEQFEEESPHAYRLYRARRL